MRKGQLSLLLIGILMAVTLTAMGLFARNQVDEVELQRIGIESVATSIKFESNVATPLNIQISEK
jgi:hypothetical protein